MKFRSAHAAWTAFANAAGAYGGFVPAAIEPPHDGASVGEEVLALLAAHKEAMQRHGDDPGPDPIPVRVSLFAMITYQGFRCLNHTRADMHAVYGGGRSSVHIARRAAEYLVWVEADIDELDTEVADPDEEWAPRLEPVYGRGKSAHWSVRSQERSA